jgi:hypothetical protein
MKSTNRLSRAIQRGFLSSQSKFTEGYCIEFALALSNHLKGSQLLVGARYYTSEGEDLENPLSHVVVEYAGQTYDVMGVDAIERWENFYANPYDCGGDEDVSFNWDVYTLKELEKLVEAQRSDKPKIDKKIILEVSKTLKDNLGRCKPIEPAPIIL